MASETRPCVLPDPWRMEIDAVSEGMTQRRTVSCSAPITRESHLQGDGAVELLAENLPYVTSSRSRPLRHLLTPVE